MQTSAWNDGGNTYGIRVGRKNREQFFDQAWNHVELAIDDAVHQIPLTAGFWKHCPEIRHPIIRDWLCRHKSLSWDRGTPPRMNLVPLTGNRFRLVP